MGLEGKLDRTKFFDPRVLDPDVLSETVLSHPLLREPLEVDLGMN